MPSLAESLTEQFYAWERRGRGWDVFDFPVRLEPPFVPFARYLPSREEGADDGRRPTIFAQVAKWLLGRKKPKASKLPSWQEVFAADPEPDESEEPIAEIQVRLPPGTDISGDLADQLLLAVASVCPRVSFELLGTAGRIVLQYAVPASQAGAVRRTLEGYAHVAVRVGVERPHAARKRHVQR
jgi:hypothetical protein